MWKNRKRVLIIGAIGAVILAATITGVALAQTNPTPTPSVGSGNSIIARVAKILNIDQSKVQSAFDQARVEASNDALDARLKQLVANGKMTQEQADKYKTWWQSRPQGMPQLGPMGRLGGGIRPGLHRQISPVPTN